MRAASNGRLVTRLVVSTALVLALLPLGALSASAGTATGPQPKIVGGTTAPAGAWPSQVGLLDRSEPSNFDAQFCGGTVVSSYWILTAAHCMFDEDQQVSPSDIDVLVGTQSLSTGGTRIHVTEIRILPGWNADTFDHDVAMVRLATPTTAPPQVIAGQGSAIPAGSDVVATGWGTEAEGAETFPTELQQVTMKQQPDSVCAKAYGSEFLIKSMSCASSPGKDTCQGDSGGPLVLKRNNVWVQVGITSWGDGCAEPGYPGISTRVPSFATWIRQQMALTPFVSSASAVTAGYKDFFNRPATVAELNKGVAALNTTSVSRYLASLSQLPAYQNRMGGLTRSYQAYFLRDPDKSGLDYWFAKVNAGWSTARVSDFFATSSEFTTRYGSLDNGAFVDLIYKNVLGRPADDAGRAYWVNQLDTARKTRGQVMVGYSDSNEFKTATAARVNVIITTYALLRRPPTETELLAGMTMAPDALVASIVSTPEYINRF